MPKSIPFVLLIGLFSLEIRAQIGGRRSFESLNVPQSAAQASLGGVNVSNSLIDPALILSNPALLREGFENRLTLTYSSYVAGIDYTSFVYPFQFKDVGLFSVGVQYFNFGDFEGFDDTGAPTNDFQASDFVISVSHSRSAGNFRYGASIKLARESIDNFGATAFLFDLGGVFIHPEKEFNVGLAIKNTGFLLSDFSETSDSSVPFDVQIGTTFKPKYMPVRFSLTTYNLWTGDVTFFDPEISEDSPSTIDRVFRRVAIGTELLLSKGVNVRVGYNHLVRQELRLEEASGGAGFSFGFLVKIKAFEISYTRSLFHVAGGNNYFTLTTDFKRILKKKQSKTGSLLESNGK
ncbi:MAG: type IX secretion system protein PorQ [Bacteroidota bacterium]